MNPDTSNEKAAATVSPSAHIASLLMRTLGSLSWNVRGQLGRALGSLVGLVPHREATIAALQLERFLPLQIARPTIRQIYAEMGQTALESLRLTSGVQEEIEMPEDLLKKLKSDGRGIVALSAHLGNWELLAASMVRRGFALTLIAREARSPVGQALIEKIRAAYGAKVIWRVDGSATKEIIRDLRAGAAVAALIDQDTDVSSTAVPFFGSSVKAPTALIHLAQRHNAQLVAAFIRRLARGRSKIDIVELDITLSAQEILRCYHQQLELNICAAPAQWVWVHKRWRTVDNRTLSSREYIRYLEGI